MGREEFYFVRHGQTNHNVCDGKNKGDHPDDVGLNETGKLQAIGIAPVIADLPLQHVCFSPLKRAQETKEILTEALQVAHCEMEELGECTAHIWKQLVGLGRDEPLPGDEVLSSFVLQVQRGIKRVLELDGPSLVVSHGGVHVALCWLLGVEEHDWVIENCVPVHFFKREDGKWIGRKSLLR